MTEIYEHALLRAPLDIVCPHCEARAVFTTAHDKALPVTLRTVDGRVKAESWEGRAACTVCGYQAAHTLDWPAQAWFQVDYKGQVLWARDQAMMTEIRRFIAAGADRNAIGKASAWWRDLVRIPSIFLSGRARDAILRKIDKHLV